MEFKSQICTSVEQSKRLLELGLKKETADMMHCYEQEEHGDKWFWNITINDWDNNQEITENCIPAWSLHRLMEIMYKGDIHGCAIIGVHNRNIDTIYELVITDIKWLIKKDRFNQDYLEEKNNDRKRDYTLHEVWSTYEHS